MDARTPAFAILALALACGGCRREAAPAATADTGSLPAPAATTTDMAPAVQPATALAVANDDGIGAYLVDGQGNALYAFSEDLGASTCPEACLQRWPALVIPTGQDAAVEAPLDASLAGKFERDDGMLVATWAKHPLYRYTADTAPGQHTGHDVTDEFGHWSLVAPDGKPIAMK
jgi:predicted lipoprotein with Yx(FWY)xxD motif